MIGQTVAHYQIAEKLGAGGMGVVYKARDSHLDRFVALKVLPPETVINSDRRNRFVQEAKAASALNHPNIVHIYDIVEVDGVHFIAMEYVRGKTIDQRIERKPLPLTEALKYAVQIADALAQAHAAGIVHRDLKPSNIMVTDEGLVKVLDFGLAKLSGRVEGDEFGDGETTFAKDMVRTDEGVIVGTVAYMSPEQAEGKSVDARSDIFSLGSVLYEMLTGQRAFRGDTKMSTLAAVLREEATPPSELVDGFPREVERVIASCLRKDRARRFQHMDDLKVALQDLIEESSSGALGALTAPPRPKRWRSSLFWIPTALATAAIGGVAWIVFRPSVEIAVTAVPLVTVSGTKAEPSLSPDGKQVAFVWNGETQDNNDIYVQLIGAGTPLRLTTHRARDFNPSWSPDGRFIAFMRSVEGGKVQVLSIPALGGPERKLGEVAVFGSFGGLTWSPDGKWLAVPDRNSALASVLAEPTSLVLLSVETGEKRKLTSPALHTVGDRTPAFSPDGRALAFSRSTLDTLSDLYVLNLSADLKPVGQPNRLTFVDGWVPIPSWMPDGREIVFSSGQWGTLNLWRVRASGSAVPRRLAYVGEDGSFPTISLQGRRLAYTKNLDDANIWRVEVSDIGGARGNLTKLIASSRLDQTPDISPDGKKIAFASNRSASWEIWVSESDGSKSAQLTSFGGPFTRYPRWSPDSKRIAFDSRAEGNAEIYVIDAEGGRPRRLTTNPAADTAPRWSADGRSIYFNSNRHGGNQVFQMPADGGEAVQLTKEGGAEGMESPDGTFFYYLNAGAVWRRRIADGDESRVLQSVTYFGAFQEGICFLGHSTATNAYGIHVLNFATNKTELVSRTERPISQGFSVSPDGRFAFYTQIDLTTSDLMLVENFR